jgi:membrane protein implicated in regulation of membrane protease activity
VIDRARAAGVAVWALWLGRFAAVVAFGAVVLASSLLVNPWCRNTVSAEDSPGTGLPYFSEWPFGPGCYTPGGTVRPPSWWWTAELLLLVASGALLWLVHRRVRGRRAPIAPKE